jgi:transposase
MSNSITSLRTERIDDVVLLLGVMIEIGLPDLLNRHLPRHGNQTGLDWGWVAVIWLSYILSQGDHRKVKVEAWANDHQRMIERTCGIELRATDLGDDRLGILLKRLSQKESWVEIETELSRRSISVYDLQVERIRLDATTISGYHQSQGEGLFQFGHSKDDPSLAQVKLMLGVLDPLGMPLVSQVVSGEQADDGLYLPTIKRITETLNQAGLLFVGDSKMSALATRSALVAENHFYLCPLPMTGNTPALMDDWIEAAISETVPLQAIERVNAKGEVEEIAEGYQLKRDLKSGKAPLELEWQERVCVIYSPDYGEQQCRGLEQRLQTASEKLLALTQPGRGKRAIKTESILQQKIQSILQQHRVGELLHVNYSWQQERYQITQVERQEQKLSQVQNRLGWKAYVTNAPEALLSLSEAVLTYRDEWRVERGFHRLKDAPLSISPLFVQRDDQVLGLCHLLSLALRLLTLIEFVVRRQLRASHSMLQGLYPENPKKQTAIPTAERLLKAFSNLNLTIFEMDGKEMIHFPPLSSVQLQILELLGLPPDLYSRLAVSSE